jgi:hypothetical protein
MPPTTYDFLAPTGSDVVDPGRLEVLGKQAAHYAENSDISLTEAVVHTLGKEKLSSEHIRRVVEFTNIEAFNKKFASLDPSNRIVELEHGPADPAAVIQGLEHRARPRELIHETNDYDSEPMPGYKSSAVNIFIEKTAAGAVQDIVNLRYKLASALDEAISSREAARYCMNESLVKLAQVTLGAVRQGATAAEVFGAWAEVNDETAKVAFSKVRHFFTGPQVKVAGRSIASDHILVGEFKEFSKQAMDFVVHTQDVSALETELANLNIWLNTHGGRR